ncbi:ATP-binding cassette domain-containing protein [Lentisphaera profundi]|uniref:ATP-binding cassette domain-containing protein n=1 Tax=Lentisphaera profundi TaxID=1658616 RepID=A0ABY7VQF8_9BACT|nr:ATP-binding cassette domain-containing protein [Lentisphaera profundi]WDE95947.1 ATP-binding cassette domain-containing protein [Lentisphaera profundi]
MSNEEFVIKGAGLQKTFKDFWGRPKVKAIQNIDITVPKGSIFGLLGPNGAGKSTLLKIILGHLYPTAGRIQVLGKDPRDVKIKQKMGYLPERSYLYKNLTATETLHYFGEILGLDKKQIKSRTEQLLEMVGLKNAIHRQVGQFSHGMTRRMGLAQALLNDPELLILDEPTAGLDPVGCREVKDLILTLGQRGKTILLTSHLLADVEDVADDLLMLFGGSVQASGKAKSLLQDQDKTRLEFPNVSKATLQKTLASLKTELPSTSINITSPNQSLEDYFLNLVRTSTAKGESTSGASAGSGVADYLKDDSDQSSESLVAGDRIQESGATKELNPQISQSNTEQKNSEPNNSKLNIQNSKLDTPGAADVPSAPTSVSTAGSTEFHSAPNSDLNLKESNPQISQNNTEPENSANSDLKPVPSNTTDESNPGTADVPSATTSVSTAGSTEFHSAPNSDLNSKESNPQISQNNTEKDTSANCQLPTDNSDLKPVLSNSTDESNPGTADVPSAPTSVSTAGSTEFHSEPNSNSENSDLKTVPSDLKPVLSNSTQTKFPDNCQLTTENFNQQADQNPTLPEDTPEAKALGSLPPVPKLGLSEHEQISIKMKKIKKHIHRT